MDIDIVQCFCNLHVWHFGTFCVVKVDLILIEYIVAQPLSELQSATTWQRYFESSRDAERKGQIK